MSRATEHAAAWVYSGVWGVLAGLFHVPREAPSLPVRAAEALQQLHPALGFLRYLKFWFWIVLLLIDGLILVGWVAVFATNQRAGLILAVPAFLIAVAPDIVAYVAIHLRYDTTWYVMSTRSIRIRRGAWVIHEVTITFENVQNVKVSSGPVQRWFGIADVVIETAGAGAGGHAAGKGGGATLNRGLIEGVADAERIRDLIMDRVRASRTAGIGDERTEPNARAASALTQAHLEVLREIRDLLTGAPGSPA